MDASKTQAGYARTNIVEAKRRAFLVDLVLLVLLASGPAFAGSSGAAAPLKAQRPGAEPESA